MQFPHTSGKQRYVSRLMKMDIPDKVQLFANTHVTKIGEFVNPIAKRKHDEMLGLKAIPTEEGEKLMSEDQILLATLGYRSGYQKGMGYGVVVPRCTKSSYIALHDSQTESKLDQANEKINTLTTQLEEQTEKNKSYEEKFEVLQAEMRKMAEVMMKMQGSGTSTNSS